MGPALDVRTRPRRGRRARRRFGSRTPSPRAAGEGLPRRTGSTAGRAAGRGQREGEVRSDGGEEDVAPAAPEARGERRGDGGDDDVSRGGDGGLPGEELDGPSRGGQGGGTVRRGRSPVLRSEEVRVSISGAREGGASHTTVSSDGTFAVERRVGRGVQGVVRRKAQVHANVRGTRRRGQGRAVQQRRDEVRVVLVRSIPSIVERRIRKSVGNVHEPSRSVRCQILPQRRQHFRGGVFRQQNCGVRFHDGGDHAGVRSPPGARQHNHLRGGQRHQDGDVER
mmetsp:Transcript_21859/g.45786  ORF Transcript_21859/g.45786 Transcript_21859/m.45786 type:complete len:281 (+) Transcript_21859:424-1266(+)